MGCCDPFRSIAENQVMNVALGLGGMRRDVIANIGSASDYANQPWFLEDRTGLATPKGDRLYVRMQDYTGSWVWATWFDLPGASGGFFP